MNYEKRKVLITVKTYPLPSKSYQELVCTAGVLENGDWIRLYPIDYRYQPYCQWYKKYQWIELEVVKHPNDPRKESFRPKVDTIQPLARLDTKRNWAERRKYVLAKGTHTMEELWKKQEADKTSLGIVRPKYVQDFRIEPVEPDWKPQWKTVFQQQRLFGPDQKPLEKIPFKFSYVFTCDNPECQGHTMMIEDWELGQLYRQMRDKFSDPNIAAQKVRQKYYDEMCDSGKDTHFFVGTLFQHPTSWIVLGVFWPKKR
ncbi:MAG: hypothetical protein A2V67_08405 [Deltaproteobacteria bacterium RBG_13_61_14]|nr:MAG: hypothetical protein A2V67_08405 [Deltaproteobacteria bacterium RBG_13_61_14]